MNVARVPVEGIWARQARPTTGGAEATAADGRWQTAAVPAAYFADSELTAWAEFYRALAEAAVAPDERMPRVLYRVAVTLGRVADLRTEKARRELGLPRLRQSSAQWPKFEAVGERLAQDGAEGRAVRLCGTNPVDVLVRVRGGPFGP